MGDYKGIQMPASFAAYQTEQDVTDRITRFATDTSPSSTDTWAKFQCIYDKAVAVWRVKSH